MTSTLCTTTELLGSEFDVTAEFEASWVDNGIGHYEFWGAKGFDSRLEWEVEEIYPPEFDCDVEQVIADNIKARGWFWRWWNPAFWVVFANTLRGVEQAMKDFDPEDLRDDAEKETENMDPPCQDDYED